MGFLDAAIVGSGLGSGQADLALLLALLLGLRHATDPDHLTAVAALVLSDTDDIPGRARRLGLSWGLGHATTLCLLGLPVVVLGPYLPEPVSRAAEGLVGLVIVLLAVRLLMRWRRGYLHAHPHTHEGVTHTHPHAHEGAHPHDGHHHGGGDHHPPSHQHTHELGRSAREAYGIGLVHGVGGSAGVVVLLLAGLPYRPAAAAALVMFAFGTAVSMTLVSWAAGVAVERPALRGRLEALVPLAGVFSLVFGVWYGWVGLGLHF